LQGTEFSEIVQTALATHSIYVLVSDLQARGMSLEQVIVGVQAVDYAGFVDLAATHYPIQAWL
jgi:tRNA 2-thiouridine synthesizing protein B